MSDSLSKLPRAYLEDRLRELLNALDKASETFANINIAAHYGGESMDQRKRGGREKLEYIERQSLGGWGSAIGTLEVGNTNLDEYEQR